MKQLMQFQVVCASGVLTYGTSNDFLVCVARAKEAKQSWSINLPNSTLRVHIFYPNKRRASFADIKAALRAVEDEKIDGLMRQRLAAAVAILPARSEARTAEMATEAFMSFVPKAGNDFCQAGVVAPPDSPDLGNSIKSVCEV